VKIDVRSTVGPMGWVRRFLENPFGWALLSIGELLLVLAVNRALSGLVGGFQWPTAVLLLILEIVVLTLANLRVRRRFLGW
jgi:hypothetical protein